MTRLTEGLVLSLRVYRESCLSVSLLFSLLWSVICLPGSTGALKPCLRGSELPEDRRPGSDFTREHAQHVRKETSQMSLPALCCRVSHRTQLGTSLSLCAVWKTRGELLVEERLACTSKDRVGRRMSMALFPPHYQC